MDSEEHFIIPFPKARCTCRHYKGQHARGEDKCDNCQCRKFRLNTSLTEAESQELDESDKWEELKRQTRLEQLRGEMCVLPDSVVEAPTPGQNEVSESAAANRGAADSGLKDSGQRLQFESGMVRDIEDNKPGYHFLIPKDVPMESQMLTRVAEHLRKGAKKYTPRNWEKGNSNEEAERARESALRHMMQWIMGETDEDHAAAVITNVIFAETMQFKANQKKENA